MNKKAIKISLRGLAPKGYTSSQLLCPSIGLHLAAAYKLHFGDRNRTELWPNDKLVNGRYRPSQYVNRNPLLFEFKHTMTAQENWSKPGLNVLLVISTERKQPC